MEPLPHNAIIDQFTKTRLMEHFRVVGTHAVYAYEAEADMRVIPSAVATHDIDLLWDVRKRVRFGTQLKRLDSLHTMHPLVFVRFKRWMAELPSRDWQYRGF